MTRRDWITDLGIGTVGLAAAILTFTTLRGLAVTVGFRETVFGVLALAWLLPVTIDAAGVVSARVWLRGTAGPDAVRYARGLTWACILASVTGNAGQHVMGELGVTPPWWVIVTVTAVPPATLGAVVHLGHLVRRTGADQDTDRAEPGEHRVPGRPVVHAGALPAGARPVGQPAGLAVDEEFAALLGHEQHGRGGLGPAGIDREPTGQPTGRAEEPTGPTGEYDRGLDSTAPDRDLVADMGRWAADRGRPVSRDDAVRAYGIGAGRARKLRLACGWPRGADEDADRSGEEADRSGTDPTAVGGAVR